MTPLSSSEIEELLGAYALDAVEPDEAAEIEAHLPTCPRCRAELAEHREVVGLFAYSGQSAPPGLWDRITAGMQETPPELRLDRMRASMVTPGSLNPTAEGRDAPLAPVVSMRSRRGAGPARRSIGARAFVALASAAAVIVAVLGVALVHTQHRADQHSAVPTLADVHAALDQKGSRKVVLASPSGAARLDAVVTPSGVSYVYDADLTPLGSDRTYQIWGFVGQEQISYGLLGTDPSIVRFNAGAGVRTLAVTEEVASGVVVSHHAAIVSGAVNPPL
jgi:anti-sigma factor RsiW